MEIPNKKGRAGGLLIPFGVSVALSGSFLVMLGGDGLKWPVVMVITLASILFLFLWEDLRHGALFGFIATAPIHIGKALISSGSTIYSSGYILLVADVFFYVLALLWLYDVMVKGRPRPHFALPHMIFLTYVLWVVGSSTIRAPETAVTCWLMYGKFFISFLLLSEILNTPKMFRIVIYGLICALIINAFFAALQFIKGGNIEIPGLAQGAMGLILKYKGAETTAFRPSGLLGHPNLLGDFLTFLVPTAGVLLLAGTRKIGKSAWWTVFVLSLIMIGTLLITLSRGAWVSSFVAVVAAMYLGMRRGLINPAKIMGIAGLLSVIIVCAVMVYPPIYLRITESDDRSSLTRILMIEQAFEIAKHNPFLGVGYGQYQSFTNEYEPASFGEYSKNYINQVKVGVVHNKYMLTLAEHGFIGLFLFLATLTVSLVWLFPLRKWKRPLWFCLALGVFSSLLAQIVFYNLDHFFADQRITLFYMFFGIGIALKRYNDQQNILHVQTFLKEKIRQQVPAVHQLKNKRIIA